MIKILAIDDKQNNLVVLTALFSRSFPDACIITALSGREGIEKALTENPDVILLDLVMPIMDGIETCKRLKEDNFLKRIPVIMITATKTDSKTRTKALETGVEAFLSKPIDEAELTAQVSCMLRIKRSEDKVIQDNERVEALVHERIKGLEESKRAALNLLEDLKTEIECRRLSEEALQHSQEQFLNLYNNAPVGLYRTTPDGKILMANRAIYEMMGFSDFKELPIKNLEESGFEPSYRREQFMEQIEKNGEVKDLEAKWICCNGEVIIVRENAKVIRDSNGKPLYYDGTVEDITGRKQVEEALLQSEKNFRRSISESPFGIRIVSVDGETIYANKVFLDIFEFNNLEEFKSTPAINRYTPESYAQHQERKEKRKNGHDVFDYEISIVRANAEIRHVKISRKEIMWNGTKHYQVINLDITEQKKLTIDLIAAKERAEESDRLKTAFLHNISHEIRTPMNAIVGFSALLGEPDIDVTTRQSYIEMIMQSSNHLLAIITDIVDISNIEANLVRIVKNEINLNTTLKALCNQFIPRVNEKKLSLTCETALEYSDAFILTDSTKLFQILSNLVNNALKFTNKGDIKLEYKVKENFLEFCVSDTGIGIPQEHHNRIFDRFYQVQNTISRIYEGAGLGLAISKAYVELLGGKIWLNSESGKGTTFYFTIPFEKSDSEGKAASGRILSESPLFRNKKTILIAEDIESNFKLLKYFLSGSNIEIVRAVNGKEAVEKCLSDQSIDLVLMDLRMPVMDGYTAVKLIRESKPDIPIIAQTAYADDRYRAIECGCTGVISKPFDKKTLLKVISEFI